MAVASLVAKVDAQVATFQKEFAEATRTAQKFEKDFANTASSVTAQQKRITDAFSTFSGDRLAREATAVAKAVEQIGGASKLTAGEQAKVNALMTEAIAKYQALGQQAPKAVLDLEAATRKLQTTTTSASTQFANLDKSMVSLGASGRSSSLAMDVLTGTFGKFTLAGVAVGIINNLGGAIVGMAQRGTQIAPLEDAFERLATGVGENSDKMLNAMHDATRGLVLDFDLMQSANKALLLGLPTTTDSMANLAKTATVLGKAMGLDATTALDNLIVALGRSSPLILDNLGLTVKVEDANRKYAEQLGKTADALSEAEKKQAFMNEALRKADERVAQIGEQSLTLTEHGKTVIVTLSNIVTGAVGTVNRAAGELVTSGINAVERVSKSLADFQGGFRNTALAMEQFNLDFANAMSAPAQSTGIETLAARAAKLRSDLSQLTAEQRKNIDAGNALGLNNKDIAEAFNRLGGSIKLTEQHLSLYADLQSKAKDAAREHGRAATKSADEIVKKYEDVRRVFEKYTEIIIKANDEIGEISGLSQRSRVELSTITSTVDLWQMYLGLIKSVNSQIRLGIDSAPGQQFSGDMLAGIWGKDETKTRDRELKKAEQFGQQISRTIIGAIQGGGDIGKAVGASLGSSIGEELGKKLATSIGGSLGSALGGAIGPLGAIGGSLVGGLFDKIFGKSQRRKDVEAFADGFGGFDKLQKRLETLPKHADTFWRALTQGGGNSKATIDAITEAFRLQDEVMNQTVPTMDEVAAAAARYGLEVDKIGDGINDLRVMEVATQFVKDWELMAKAGANMNEVAIGMVDEMQVLVDESLKWGHALPEAMRPILEKMLGMGTLTDDAGEKLEDLSGIKFARPLEQAIDGLITKLDELIGKISGGLGGALRGLPSSLDVDVPALGKGGIVNRPTLALIGESGPEAVIPLGGGSSLGGGSEGGTFVAKLYLDGREAAEAVAPHLPHVLRRRGAA